MLREVFGTVSHHGMERWQAVLLNLKLKRLESLADAIVRLNDTVACKEVNIQTCS